MEMNKKPAGGPSGEVPGIRSRVAALGTELDVLQLAGVAAPRWVRVTGSLGSGLSRESSSARALSGSASLPFGCLPAPAIPARRFRNELCELGSLG